MVGDTDGEDGGAVLGDAEDEDAVLGDADGDGDGDALGDGDVLGDGDGDVLGDGDGDADALGDGEGDGDAEEDADGDAEEDEDGDPDGDAAAESKGFGLAGAGADGLRNWAVDGPWSMDGEIWCACRGGEGFPVAGANDAGAGAVSSAPARGWLCVAGDGAAAPVTAKKTAAEAASNPPVHQAGVIDRETRRPGRRVAMPGLGWSGDAPAAPIGPRDQRAAWP